MQLLSLTVCDIPSGYLSRTARWSNLLGNELAFREIRRGSRTVKLT